jgi:hypothetical protein
MPTDALAWMAEADEETFYAATPESPVRPRTADFSSRNAANFAATQFLPLVRVDAHSF